jgi:hypothetical protein
MVSRTTQNGDTNGTRRQTNGTAGQTKEGKSAGTPRQSKKESSTPKPAQDAELKDYVCFLEMVHNKAHNEFSNLGTASERGPLDLSLGHSIWEQGRR